MTPFTNTTEQNTDQTTLDEVLYHTLEQEQLCIEQVISLLRVEQKAIIERDIKTIDHLLDKKLPLLSKLEQLDKQRQSFFEKQTGLPYNNTAFSLFIEQHSSTIIRDIWFDVKAQLPECKKQNDVNGRLIAVKKNNTEQILQILLGRPVNTASPTYSHLGQTNLQKRNALYASV